MSRVKKLIRKAGNAYFDFRSKNITEKVLVIESDDWGSIRTKNAQCREKLNQISPEIQKDCYTQLDNLADSDDLNALYEVLNSVKDGNGNPACITANVCTANPNFDQIREGGFETFYYEPFNESIKKIHGNQVWTLWNDGMAEGMLRPQLHGREHLHALQWMAELRAGNQDLLKAFELESFGIPYKPILKERRKNLQAALDIYGIVGEEAFQKNWVEESADLFENVFGFLSTTFIPPAYIWHARINRYFNDIGIEAIQGIKLQYQPQKDSYKKKVHYIGEKKNGLIYLVRNAFFEPASDPETDWVKITLSEIDRAFRKKQPAIIGSHRINFIGNLEESNRTQNLTMLKEILNKIVYKYPEMKFMSSDNLLKILKK